MDERKEKILQAIIDDYIASAEPVGSRALIKKHDLGVSAATVRNEMADLEMLGYLEHIHTSSGRVPSSKGYRFYVDGLQITPVSEKEQKKIERWYKARVKRIDEVFQETAKLISEVTRNVTLMLAPEVGQAAFRCMHFLPLDENRAIAVLMTDAGFVENKIIDMPKGATFKDFQDLANIVNSRLAVTIGEENESERLKDCISAELLAKNDQLAIKGKIPLFVSSGKRALGIIALEDKIPPGLMTAIRRLKKMGIKTLLITGDSKRTANAVRKQLEIDEAKGDLTKDAKLREIKLLKVAGNTVGMIGDLNRDQMLLEAADIGIELIPKKYEPIRKNVIEVAGTEEDNIKYEPEESPSIPPYTPDLILKGGLGAIIPAIEAARCAGEISRQNVIIAYLTWLLILPAAMGFFVSFGGAFLSLDLALMGVSISLLLIFLNSLRAH